MKKYFPLLSAFILLALVFLWLYSESLLLTMGNFTFILDDAYIHLTIAKNLLLYQVPGINPGEFAFCTSSPLWTLVLYFSGFVSGINTSNPLNLNLFISFVLILISYNFLKIKSKNPLYLALILILLIVATPLHSLIFSGMEHLLQIILMLPAVFILAEIASDKRKFTVYDSHFFFLLFLMPFITTVRYEGLFFLFISFIILIIKKKFSGAFILLGVGLLPLILLGILSTNMGWYFLPNSVLLKSSFPEVVTFKGLIKYVFYNFYANIAESPSLLILFLLAASLLLGIYRKIQRISQKSIILLGIYLSLLVLHLQFASTGWFYRYEAYLVFLGVLIIGFTIPDIYHLYQEKIWQTLSKYFKIAIYAVLFISVSPLINRGIESFNRIPQASANIYEQQVTTSNFIRYYLKGKTIAINDIGAVSFYSESKILDLWGLADLDIARAKRSGKFNSYTIKSILKSRKSEVAIIYADWYEGPLKFYRDWYNCGSLRIINNYACGSDRVNFFAKDSSLAQKISADLIVFSNQISNSIIKNINKIPIKEN